MYGHPREVLMADRRLNAALDSDILITHDRFMAAMRLRLEEMPFDTKERYFALLSILVAKLEDPGKALQEVLREMVAESATIVMAEMQK
jgi:hypothetical protein